MKIYYHSADFDGIGSREAFRHHYPNLSDDDFIGWNFGDPIHPIPDDDRIVVVDLNPLDVFGQQESWTRIVWIDHHKTAIDRLPETIPGYRIDGVAACRLAWQWCLWATGYAHRPNNLPCKDDYVNRSVNEPELIRLLGEYDIWDKRDPSAETLQIALKTMPPPDVPWQELLRGDLTLQPILNRGHVAASYRDSIDSSSMRASYVVEFEGLKFLALNGRGNSLTFRSVEESDNRPEYDALLMYFFDGKQWTTSLYHSMHNTEVDLSKIAVKHGGGGHKGACGFQTASISHACVNAHPNLT